MLTSALNAEKQGGLLPAHCSKLLLSATRPEGESGGDSKSVTVLFASVVPHSTELESCHSWLSSDGYIYIYIYQLVWYRQSLISSSISWMMKLIQP